MSTPLPVSDADLIVGYADGDALLRDIPTRFHLPVLLLRAVSKGEMPEPQVTPLLRHYGITPADDTVGEAKPEPKLAKKVTAARARKAAK